MNEAQCKQMLGKHAIGRMMCDYSCHLDKDSPKELDNISVEDCEVIYAPSFGDKGNEVCKTALEGIGAYFAAAMQHNTSIAIDFVNDTALDVRSVVMTIHPHPKERLDGYLVGQYHDTAVKGARNPGQSRRTRRTDARRALMAKFEEQRNG